jgi:hypothetical protein
MPKARPSRTCGRVGMIFEVGHYRCRTLTRIVEKTKPPRGVYSLDGFATLATGQIPATLC